MTTPTPSTANDRTFLDVAFSPSKKDGAVIDVASISGADLDNEFELAMSFASSGVNIEDASQQQPLRLLDLNRNPTNTFRPNANSPLNVAGPSAMISPSLTRCPTCTSGF